MDEFGSMNMPAAPAIRKQSSNAHQESCGQARNQSRSSASSEGRPQAS
jgi:hypothetical protein